MVEELPEKDIYLKLGKKKLLLKTLRSLVLVMAILILGIGIGYQYRDRSGPNSPLMSNLSATNGNPAPLEREDLDFTMFWQVWDQLEQTYIEPEDADPQQMIYGAIAGMTAALGDPYTVFLPPVENQQAKEDLNGAFDGVGIQLGYKRDTLAVMAPLEEHPAIKQGVRAGDLILNIKDDAKGIDEDTAGMTLPEAVTLIRGEKGTPVTLTLYRDEKGQFEVTIVRDTIVIPSVVLEMGDWDGEEWVESEDGRIAWMKLRRFGDRTQEQWDEAVLKVMRNRDAIDGVVLDVRNNPGGYLNGAISLASDFVPEGVVVEQEGRFETQTYEVDRRGRLIGVPVVVVINGGSASASEILAGALRDRVDATLVGVRSFGKGTVQEAVDLEGNAGLHVTTARWLLPSGDWIHDDGLEPNIEIELDDIDEASDSAEIIDRQLQRAIEALRE